MKQKAVVQEINVYHKKEIRFWYLDCFVKILDGANADGEGKPFRLIKASSFLPLWRNIKYCKQADALLDVSN